MPLEWTHEACGDSCPGTTECAAFPTLNDRVNIARAAFTEYSDADGTGVEDFLADVLLYVAHDHGTTVIERAIARLQTDWNANHISLEVQP